MGSPYSGFRDLLPPKVRQAYQTGMRKLGQRIIDWGVRGEEHFYDMIIPIGLWYASQVVDDPKFSRSRKPPSGRPATCCLYRVPKRSATG